MLDGSRSDPQRRLQRLQSLLTAWEHDRPDDAGGDADTAGGDAPADSDGGFGADTAAHAAPVAATSTAVDDAADAAGAASADAAAPAWTAALAALQQTLSTGLARPDAAAPAASADAPRAAALATRLASLADAVAADGPLAEHVDAIALACAEARGLFVHRHRLIDALAALCRELGSGLADFADDDRWVQGQGDALQRHLAEGLSVRGVAAATAMLGDARAGQARLRGERSAARDALKALVEGMLQEVETLGEHTGRFEVAAARHVEQIARAETLGELTGVVQALLDDGRSVHAAVAQSQARLVANRDRAVELEGRVRELEAELKRVSDEVATDALTQVANRRGLEQAFAAEAARVARADRGDDGATAMLAIGLIDIDNFKRLNDSLGHAAGDVALQRLAAAVRERLRPIDHLARFGGEEFVVLLPGSDAAAAQAALTRLQRSLSAALFMHDDREVFVTFSAGVTAWRPGETLTDALARADEALYDAKRSGKNRTCAA